MTTFHSKTQTERINNNGFQENETYKDTELLSRFIAPDGKILARSSTGTSAKYQRELAKAIKNARFMGLLPEVGQR